MTRNAHRDTLLPLVQALGYALLWRAIRTRDWRFYASAGAVLGLAIYTYSPGRFVGVFVAAFVAIEFVVSVIARRRRSEAEMPTKQSPTRDAGIASRKPLATLAPHASAGVTLLPLDRRGVIIAGVVAFVVMLPLGIYFAQNPAQFMRRFDSTSIFDQASPALALATSIVGNLAQFIIPGAGYQSWHYNLPGKPVFDLLIAPWFVGGLMLAFARARHAQYRFLLLWFVVMAMPAFLTADMIPKGVRVFGVVPGVFIFPALAMDWLWERTLNRSLHAAISKTRDSRFNRMEFAAPLPFAIVIVSGLIALSFVGSAVWTTYDYFVAWANAPELPLRFDADYAELADFVQRQPANEPIYISAETYRPPTFMLLGRQISTSRYLERATRIREFDARTLVVTRANEINAAYVTVREQKPPYDWLMRVAPQVASIGDGEYLAAYRLEKFAPPQRALDVVFNPLLKLTGVSRFDDAPNGIVLYWQVSALPENRDEIQTTLMLAGAQTKQRFGFPPLEWQIGDVIIEWYAFDSPAGGNQFSIQMTRGVAAWRSPIIDLK